MIYELGNYHGAQIRVGWHIYRDIVHAMREEKPHTFEHLGKTYVVSGDIADVPVPMMGMYINPELLREIGFVIYIGTKPKGYKEK